MCRLRAEDRRTLLLGARQANSPGWSPWQLPTALTCLPKINAVHMLARTNFLLFFNFTFINAFLLFNFFNKNVLFRKRNFEITVFKKIRPTALPYSLW